MHDQKTSQNISEVLEDFIEDFKSLSFNMSNQKANLIFC